MNATLDSSLALRRDAAVDLARAWSAFMVVLGHWLVSAVWWEQGRFVFVSPLALHPSLHALTWLFQVVPVFLFVGGFANAASWKRRRAASMQAASFAADRARRLFGPTLRLLGLWVAAVLLLRGVGLEWATVLPAIGVAVMPLWFIAVYSVVCALAPWTVALDERWGWWVPIVLAATTALVDLARWGLGAPAALGALNVVAVFLFHHQLGHRYQAGALSRGRSGSVLLLAAIAGMVLLVVVLGYPLTVVGIPGATRSNTFPPSLMMVLLCLAQVGAFLVLAPAVEWLSARPRLRPLIWRLPALAMPVFAWHQSALVVVVVATAAILGGPLPGLHQPPTGAEWLTARLGWLPVFAGTLVLLLRFDAGLSRYLRILPSPRHRPAVGARRPVSLSSDHELEEVIHGHALAP